MTGPLKNITSSMNIMISTMRQMQNATNQNVNVDRSLIAAQRQIASAEAEINEQIDQSRRSQDNFNRSVQTGERQTNGLLRSVRNIAAAYLTFQGARQLGSTTIGGAMQQQEMIDTFVARAGNEALGNAIYDQVTKQALKMGQDVNAALSGTMSFMSNTMNPQQLNELNSLAARLSKLNPGEGLQGAAFSLKELMSGDYTSIAERFNISRSMLKDSEARIAGMNGDIEGFILGMEKLLASQNLTEEAFEKMLDSPAAKWQRVLQTFKFNMAQSGEQALQLLMPMLDRINSAFEVGEIQPFFNALSTGLTTTVNIALSLGSALYQVYEFISTNWTIIEPIVWGIVGAFGAWFAITRIQAAAQGILTLSMAAGTIVAFAQTAAVFGLTAAWRTLNAVQKANVFILIISLVAGLIIWLVHLWKTNDAFAAGLMRAWNGILNFFGKIPGYFWQLVEWLMTPFEWWAQSIGKIYDEVINGIIKGINEVLKIVNKVTGSSYEIAAEFSFENVAKGMKEYAQIQKDLSFSKAAEKAVGREQKVLDFLDSRAARRAEQEVEKENKFTSGMLALGDQENPNINRVNEVGKIRDDVDISSEDLKTMRELAEMRIYKTLSA